MLAAVAGGVAGATSCHALLPAAWLVLRAQPLCFRSKAVKPYFRNEAVLQQGSRSVLRLLSQGQSRSLIDMNLLSHGSHKDEVDP